MRATAAEKLVEKPIRAAALRGGSPAFTNSSAPGVKMTGLWVRDGVYDMCIPPRAKIGGWRCSGRRIQPRRRLYVAKLYVMGVFVRETGRKRSAFTCAVHEHTETRPAWGWEMP